MSSNEFHINDGIRAVMNFFRLTDRYRETKIIACWEEVAGKVIASHTSMLRLYGRSLRVKLDSSVIRSEILHAQQELITSLNERLGENWVEKIVPE